MNPHWRCRIDQRRLRCHVASGVLERRVEELLLLFYFSVAYVPDPASCERQHNRCPHENHVAHEPYDEHPVQFQLWWHQRRGRHACMKANNLHHPGYDLAVLREEIACNFMP